MTSLYLLLSFSLVFYSLTDGRAIGRNTPDHDFHRGYDVIGDSSAHLGASYHHNVNPHDNRGIMFVPSSNDQDRHEHRDDHRRQHHQTEPMYHGHLPDQLRRYLSGSRGRYHHTIGNTMHDYSRRGRGPM